MQMALAADANDNFGLSYQRGFGLTWNIIIKRLRSTKEQFSLSVVDMLV